MAVSSLVSTPTLDAAKDRLALAVADANWYTTENLFREVGRDGVSTLLLKCHDYLNAWRKGLPLWSWRRRPEPCGSAHWTHDLVLPSGWMKRFPRLGMRPIARSVRQWRRAHARDGRLALVMTYPHYLYLRDILRPERHIYFNVDDYALYWPRFAQQIDALEQQAAREADLTVCVSKLRADELRAKVPEASARIRHLPHGSPGRSLAEHPWEQPAPPPADLAHLPRPILGYIGTLEDRLDWRLLTRVSDAFPRASIVIVGKPVPKQDGAWYAEWQEFVSRPNVHALGWRPQESIHEYNRTFDVCLIPYRIDHPFNRACCPTKIMDYMGTGRPIVSTALPECQLYTHLFHVAANDDAFLASIREILDAHSNDGRATARFDWARANTCERVVERLLSWLPD